MSDSSSAIHKHQVGFNATETFRFFQRSADDLYKVHYRYKVNPQTSFRAGLNYSLDTSDQGSLLIDLKAGMDKIFKDYGNWKFYWGGDITAGYEKFSSSSRKNYQAGIAPFFGAIFYVHDHFSISTEPGLLFSGKYYKNTDTFNPDDSEFWIEMDIVNVGQIIISVHF